MDAVKESERGAMTVTKRSVPLEIEPPSVMFCPISGFKPSTSRKYNLSFAPEDIFSNEHWIRNEYLEKNMIYKRNVKELYEEFQYGNSLTFTFFGFDLKFGRNIWNGGVVELKIVPTLLFGNCYVIEFDEFENWNGYYGFVYVAYSQNLEMQDIPRGFLIYIIPKDDWHSIALDDWEEHHYPLKIDTMSYKMPLNVVLKPLLREYYYPLLSNTHEMEDAGNFTQKDCLQSEIIIGIKKIHSMSNCTNLCIPLVFSSFLNASEIKICTNFYDHFCGGFWLIRDLVGEAIEFCTKTKKVVKSFTGWEKFKDDGITNQFPETIDKDREKRTLIFFYWQYNSNMTTIIEEKLVYGPKDLLAWLGGALGLFVGYSFFDLTKHIIDIAFYFVYKLVSPH